MNDRDGARSRRCVAFDGTCEAVVAFNSWDNMIGRKCLLAPLELAHSLRLHELLTKSKDAYTYV
jgi:hypothetical protein